MTIVKKSDKTGSTELEITLDTRTNDTLLLIYSIQTDMGLQNLTVFITIFRILSNICYGSFCENSQRFLAVTIFVESSIIDVWKGPKYASGIRFIVFPVFCLFHAINQFHATVLSLYPLKTSENQRFLMFSGAGLNVKNWYRCRTSHAIFTVSIQACGEFHTRKDVFKRALQNSYKLRRAFQSHP